MSVGGSFLPPYRTRNGGSPSRGAAHVFEGHVHVTKQDAAVPENTTTYAHSGLEEEVVELTEADASSSVTSRYVHLGQAPPVMERDGQIRFFGTDLHTDVAYLANSSGTLVGDPSYGPWGKKRTSSGEDPRFEF